MELLLEGFATILQPQNLLLIFVAVVLGIMFGAIPGLSAFTALVIMFPITYSMAPMIGVSFLVNVYIGACSGGLIAAVLLGIPGTPSSIATCFDGFPMAKRGESGKALGVCILYSFLGGTFGGIALVFLGPIIARFALNFGPYEYFAVILFALTTISSLSEGSIVKGLLSCLLGISVSFAGIDILGAYTRYTFGFSSLAVGFSMVPILIGCFAGSQILESAAQSRTKARISMQTKPAKIRGFGISRKDFIRQAPNSLISALIGLVIGILPGIGGNISNLIAYSFSKKRSKYPEKYGTGIIDGLIASETANNATIAGALIILMTLGIPGDNATSMILAGFQLHGITPGPLLFKTSANLVYAVFAAYLLGNLIMLITERVGLPFFSRMLSIPIEFLLPVVMAFCYVGAFSGNNRIFDIGVMIAFGFIGYIMKRFKYPLAPLVVGVILAPLLELNLRRSLMRTDGSWIPILTSPIAAVFLVITFFTVALSIRSELKKGAKKNPAAEG